MTELGGIIMDCQAVGGMDRLVLYGWAAQLEEGNDTVYASKTTVADFLGISDDTVLRRTQSLVKAGLMIDTGEQKQWNFGWTPVYTINVPKILELSKAQPRKMRGAANCTPPQNAVQGSGSRFRSAFRSGSVAASPATTTTTGLQPVEVSAVNLEADQKAKTENPGPKVKTCPKCGLPWSRDKGHLCMDMPIGREPEDGFNDGYIPRPLDPNWGGQRMTFEDDGYDGKPIWTDAWKQERLAQIASQKTAESAVREGKPTPTSSAFAHAPGSASPPSSCIVCGDLLDEEFDNSPYCSACIVKVSRQKASIGTKAGISSGGTRP